MSKYIIKKNFLKKTVSSIFQKCGLSKKDSIIASDALCYADENGFTTHGVINLERVYVKKLLENEIKPVNNLVVKSDFGATSLIDGQNGLGLVIGSLAMDRAIEKAKEFGVGVVTVRQSSHFGSAGYYTYKALKENMIGISMTNLGSQTIAPPLMGKVKMLGTNPISVSAPAKNLPNFNLDMGTTVVATGKIRLYEKKGLTLPVGWLVDEQGNPVTDPSAYDNGSGFLQFLGGGLESGGNKGYGLALMVDILCGILSGANVGPSQNVLNQNNLPNDDNNIGHFFMAINIDAFRPKESFKEDLDQMLGTILKCPPNTPDNQVVYPGYLEHKFSEKFGDNNIELDVESYKSLKLLCNTFDIELNLT